MAGEAGELVEESVLEGGVLGGGRDRGRSAVLPHLTGPQGVGVVGGGEPGLGEVALFEVVTGGWGRPSGSVPSRGRRRG